MTWLPQIFAYIEFSAESKLVDFRFSAELGSFCFGEKKMKDCWNMVAGFSLFERSQLKAVGRRSGTQIWMPNPFSFRDLCKRYASLKFSFVYLLLKRQGFFALSWRINLGKVLSCCFTIFETTFVTVLRAVYSVYIRWSFWKNWWQVNISCRTPGKHCLEQPFVSRFNSFVAQ